MPPLNSTQLETERFVVGFLEAFSCYVVDPASLSACTDHRRETKGTQPIVFGTAIALGCIRVRENEISPHCRGSDWKTKKVSSMNGTAGSGFRMRARSGSIDTPE